MESPDLVSIILPSYNRSDVIQRAIDSVQSQTFQNWELVVVDDGSCDNTQAVVDSYGNKKIVYCYQENGGCYKARNVGLRLAKGDFITFLDSDDEWLPHYLEIATSFLKNSQEDEFVLTEFWAYYDEERYTFDRHDFANSFKKKADVVGSSMLDLEEGCDDDYLRVYSTKDQLGGYLTSVKSIEAYGECSVYHGDIYDYFRWGHIGWLPTTMLTRKAFEKVGFFPEDYRTAADYRFLALLCKNFRANMIAVPCAVKHETGVDGKRLSESHLATGQNEYRYACKRIDLFMDLFGELGSSELELVHGLYHQYAAEVAVSFGDKENAAKHIVEARNAGLRTDRLKRLEFIHRWMPVKLAMIFTYRLLKKIELI